MTAEYSRLCPHNEDGGNIHGENEKFWTFQEAAAIEVKKSFTPQICPLEDTIFVFVFLYHQLILIFPRFNIDLTHWQKEMQ